MNIAEKKANPGTDLDSWVNFEKYTYKIAAAINVLFHSIDGNLIPIKNEGVRIEALSSLKEIYKVAKDLHKQAKSNRELVEAGKKPEIDIPTPALEDADDLVINPSSERNTKEVITAFWEAAEDILNSVASGMDDSPLKDMIATLIKDGQSFIDNYFKEIS